MLEAVSGGSSTIKSLGGHPATHPLGETYFTQVPLRYGAYVAKLRLQPSSPALTALYHKSIDIAHSPNALRDAMREYFSSQSAVWELQAQLCRDLERMPIENASLEWPEDVSSYLRIAQLTVPQQDAWPEQTAAKNEDALSFSPWHGITAHQPLGSIMRVRKASYEASVRFRAEHNRVIVREAERPPHFN